VCPILLHCLSCNFPRALLLISVATPTILMAFPPGLIALPKLCSDPGCRSNPIAHRVRRKRQRLPPSLLIENASDRDPAPPPQSAPEAFPIKASDIRESWFAFCSYGRVKATSASFRASSVILGWPPAAMTMYCLPFTL